MFYHQGVIVILKVYAFLHYVMTRMGKKIRQHELTLPAHCTQRRAEKESPQHTARGNAVYLGAEEPCKCTHLKQH